MALEVGFVVSAGASVDLSPPQLQPQPPVFGRVILVSGGDVTIQWADGRQFLLPLDDAGDHAGIDVIRDLIAADFSEFIGSTVQVGRFDDNDVLISGTPGFIGVVTTLYNRAPEGGPSSRNVALVLTPEGLWFEAGLVTTPGFRIIPDRS